MKVSSGGILSKGCGGGGDLGIVGNGFGGGVIGAILGRLSGRI